MVRSFIACVGLLYLVLAFWCAFSPEATSQSVGFTLQSGSGQSEFLTVYGGLELGLGILFLLPLFKQEYLRFSLLTCVIIHGSLVFFRTIGFFIYSGFESITFNLAAGEWLIFVISLVLWLRHNQSNH